MTRSWRSRVASFTDPVPFAGSATPGAAWNRTRTVDPSQGSGGSGPDAHRIAGAGRRISDQNWPVSPGTSSLA